ncbi:MAG: hypothetical protein K8R59_07415 [Thermoanaerobaculales bacterium]|nr:hypothetical protein [Thermoanaerobaculales bacterium]
MRGQVNPRGMGGGFGFSSAPTPPDVVALVAAVFLTFVFQFFQITALLVAALRLGPGLYRGALWQVVTYAFMGFGPASLWFLLSLLILFWFGRDVFSHLGRRRFWRLLLTITTAAGVIAGMVRGLGLITGQASPNAFFLMQGQYMLLTIMVAAFATLYGRATILLFFVLPVQARWFLPLEIVFAFMGYLNTKDFAGFIGLCAAVGLTWALLNPGGPRRSLKDSWLRLRRLIIEQRLARMRRKRKFDVIDGDGDWLH